MAIDGVNSGYTGSRNYTDLLNGTAKTTSSERLYNNVKFSNEDQSNVNVQDFLNLMVTQLTNQDFMNPVDDTQYLSQLAQFSSMSAMQELASFSKQSFAMSYLGKEVTASVYNIGGEVETTTGKVTSVSLVGDDYKFTVNGKEFALADIKSVSDTAAHAEEKAQTLVAEANNMTVLEKEKYLQLQQDAVALRNELIELYTKHIQSIDDLPTMSDVEQSRQELDEKYPTTPVQTAPQPAPAAPAQPEQPAPQISEAQKVTDATTRVAIKRPGKFNHLKFGDNYDVSGE